MMARYRKYESLEKGDRSIVTWCVVTMVGTATLLEKKPWSLFAAAAA